MACNAATDFVDWMTSTLSGTSFAQRHFRRSASVVVLTAANTFILRQGTTEPDQEFDDLVGLEQGLTSNKVREVVLVIEQGLYFAQHLSPARLPRSRARALATLDINENFPFLRNDSYMFVHNQADGARYVVLKNRILDPLVFTTRKNNITISALKVDTGAEICTLPGATDTLKGHYARATFTKYMGTAVAVLSCLCLLGTAAHFYIRNESAISELDNHIEKRQQVVSAIVKRNKARDELIKLQQQARSTKLGTRPVSEVLDDLTAFLPDTAWLTDVSFANSEITITGYSNAAADLIPVLETSGSFHNATFTSQVTKVPGQDGECFSIRMIANARY